MVKQTQIICQQIAEEFFECVWSFCEIGAKSVEEDLNSKLWL